MPNGYDFVRALQQSQQSQPLDEQRDIFDQSDEVTQLDVIDQLGNNGQFNNCGQFDDFNHFEQYENEENLRQLKIVDHPVTVAPFESTTSVGTDIPFEEAIRYMVKKDFIPYMSAVRKLIEPLTENAIANTLMRRDTSLLNMCQIAEVDERIKNMALYIFTVKYDGDIDLTEHLNQWSLAQMKRFFETFGELIITLDARLAHCPDLILRHIATYCLNLMELKCTITNIPIITELTPFFLQLDRLHVTDRTLEQFVVVEPNLMDKQRR